MANQSHNRGEPPKLDNGSLPSPAPFGEPEKTSSGNKLKFDSESDNRTSPVRMIPTDAPVPETCPYGGPVITVEELDTLDSDEMIEGYRDGFNDEPRPSGNRSKAYWHGWHNGMVDGGHAEIDAAQMTLVRKVVGGPSQEQPS